MTSFGNSQKLVYDRGTPFTSTDFSTFFLEFGITHAPRTKWPLWTNGKVEIQNKHLSRHFHCYLFQAGNDWAKLVFQFAFAENTSVISSTGTTPYEFVFGFKPQLPLSLNLGLVRDDNASCQSELCKSLPKHTHVNRETSHSCIDNLLSPKTWMALLKSETQFKSFYRKLSRKVRQAYHPSLSYRSRYKLAQPLRVGQKVLLETHNSPFRKSQKVCELWSGPYILIKVSTKANYQIGLDADPMRTQVILRNHLAEYFTRDIELPNLLSNYEKPFNDDESEHFYNEYVKYRLFQLNQPVDSFVAPQHLIDFLPIFLTPVDRHE